MSNYIPMSPDVAALAGSFGERIQNRSLLIEKFVFPKHSEDYKADEAADAQKLRQSHSARLLQLIKSMPEGQAATFCARLESRLALNLADGLIQNAGISLDRLFGLPIINGSALKGCSRHAALKHLNQVTAGTPEAKNLLQRFIRVFGCSENDFTGSNASLSKYGSFEDAGITESHPNLKGGVTFLPASPVTEVDIEVDIINVHTMQYYNEGRESDLRNESPRPNPFPVVAAGTTFGFSLALNSIGLQAEDSRQVLQDARTWLEEALYTHGIGAKTGSGYGWFSPAPETEQRIQEEQERESKRREEERRKAEEAEKVRRAEEERLKNLDP